jgi:hypothetical protein
MRAQPSLFEAGAVVLTALSAAFVASSCSGSDEVVSAVQFDAGAGGEAPVDAGEMRGMLASR